MKTYISTVPLSDELKIILSNRDAIKELGKFLMDRTKRTTNIMVNDKVFKITIGK